MIPTDTIHYTPNSSGLLDTSCIPLFQTQIHAKGRALYRSFQWREAPYDPYHILVSEIMLQQTQVGRVAVKFPEFIGTFPTLQALADAPLRAVLQAWAGLGYNRRGIYLQQAAQQIIRSHHGIIPHDTNILIALPGIGINTAGSIAAFSYQKPTTFIETNIRTVFIHTFFSHLLDSEKIHDRDILKLIHQTVDLHNPRGWYYALMDYGSYLKNSLSNPSRKSRHHTIQSRFKGSTREIRGAIIRYLSQHERLPAELMYAQFPDRHEQCTAALHALMAEGTIIQNGDDFTIPAVRITHMQ